VSLSASLFAISVPFTPRPARSTLFPYTTLFRSEGKRLLLFSQKLLDLFRVQARAGIPPHIGDNTCFIGDGPRRDSLVRNVFRFGHADPGNHRVRLLYQKQRVPPTPLRGRRGRASEIGRAHV